MKIFESLASRNKGGLNPLDYGRYSTPGFRPLMNNLRILSNDGTPLTDKYVSQNRDIIDMIINNNAVSNISYDPATKTLIITNKDGSKQYVPLVDEDEYLNDVSLSGGTATFTLTNGTEMEMDIKSEFYDKTEIDNKDDLRWNEF